LLSDRLEGVVEVRLETVGDVLDVERARTAPGQNEAARVE